MKIEKSPSGHQLSSNEWSVLDCLAWRHNETAHCAWPSVATIATTRHLSVSSVSRVLRSLANKRVIAIVPGKQSNGVFQPNKYHIVGLDCEDPGKPIRRTRRYNNLGKFNHEAKSPHGGNDTTEGLQNLSKTSEIVDPCVISAQAVRQECASPCVDSAQVHVSELLDKRLRTKEQDSKTITQRLGADARVSLQSLTKKLKHKTSLDMSEEEFQKRKAFLDAQRDLLLARGAKTEATATAGEQL